jgi:hypothetical protein
VHSSTWLSRLAQVVMILAHIGEVPGSYVGEGT